MIPNNLYSCSDYMVLFFGYMNRVKNRQLVETKTGLRPDRLICKTFPNNFNREIKISFSVGNLLQTILLDKIEN